MCTSRCEEEATAGEGFEDQVGGQNLGALFFFFFFVFPDAPFRSSVTTWAGADNCGREKSDGTRDLRYEPRFMVNSDGHREKSPIIFSLIG